MSDAIKGTPEGRCRVTEVTKVARPPYDGEVVTVVRPPESVTSTASVGWSEVDHCDMTASIDVSPPAAALIACSATADMTVDGTGRAAGADSDEHGAKGLATDGANSEFVSSRLSLVAVIVTATPQLRPPDEL